MQRLESGRGRQYPIQMAGQWEEEKKGFYLDRRQNLAGAA